MENWKCAGKSVLERYLGKPMKILKNLMINSVPVRYKSVMFPAHLYVVNFDMIDKHIWKFISFNTANALDRLNRNRWYILETLTKYIK